jgi:hypothetical protein
MDSTALVQALTSLNNSQREHLLKEAPLISVHQILKTIPDPRRGQGRRYDEVGLGSLRKSITSILSYEWFLQ